MPSLLLTVFFLQIFVHLINKVGATTINELLWVLFNRFPTSTSRAANEQIALKREIVRLKREMGAVSAQDEFTKWAKLRRQHDKAEAEFNKKSSDTQSVRSKFDTAITALRWILTTGVRIYLQFYYSKQPLFWIPEGWLPGYVEWTLSFPRAPRGSVSIQVWQLACSSVIAMVSEAVVAGLKLKERDALPGGKGKGAPMEMRSGVGEKKEL